MTGRLTMASSGQLNPAGKTAATCINIVGDITYHAKDGTVAIGLIAQNNVKIPMYAPMLKSGSLSTMSMEVDCALIAQQGAEFVNRDSSGSSSGWGPRRGLLTIFGSVSSFGTPTRATFSGSGSDYCGFEDGANSYDGFLLHNPPPYFPTIGSYQILDWQELPEPQGLDSGGMKGDMDRMTRKRTGQQGLTLIEILMVWFVVLVIAAVAGHYLSGVEPGARLVAERPCFGGSTGILGPPSRPR